MKFGEIINNWKSLKVDYSNVPDIVDRASFRPDSEAVRALKYRPSDGSVGNPMYDYVDGKIPKNDPVSNDIVLLRSGRYDKAEIDKVKQKIIDDAKSTGDEQLAEAIRAAVLKNLGIVKDKDSDTSGSDGSK